MLHLNRGHPVRKAARSPEILLEWVAHGRYGLVKKLGRPKAGHQRGMIFVRWEWTIMSTPADVRLARRVLRHELEAIRGNWGWILALGIVLVVVGTLAIVMPLAASLASAVAFGLLFLVGGIAQLVGSFWTRDWSGFFLTLLVGILYVVLGLMFLRHPGDALLALSLFLACALMVSGLFRIIGSLMYRFPQWGWTFLSGVISLLLGIYIYALWPLDSYFVVGLFVGIDMIFTGWTWVALALAVRNLTPRPASPVSGAAPNPAA
jgi:uncharacterized membrane protein HdeD (DUF308 family)